jgi:Mob1/phocein family
MNGLQQIVSGHHHYFEIDVIEYRPQINHAKCCTLTCNSILRATSAVDFFNEISLIWGIVCELGIPRCPVGDGFPQGFEYRWADGEKVTVPIRCSGPQYVDYVLTWVEEKLNDGVTFPSSTGTFFSVLI